MAKYTLVMGDDCMALYRDNLLVVQGAHLSFGDVLEACMIPCDIVEADFEWYYDRAKVTYGMPGLLSEVPLQGEKA